MARSEHRRWGKTAQTQADILDAAVAVFAERGYTTATIADVIERAGSSVGSIYHHFGGKAELFHALWAEHTQGLERSAAEAVAKAREDGVSTPIALFEAGGAAYLRAVWRDRRVARIFWTGDAPPGFEVLRRQRGQAWIENNLKLLGLAGSLEDRFVAAVFTAIMGEAARTVIGCARSKQAEAIIAEAVRVSRAVAESRGTPD
ncbi:TetR/AcrR family transcriptional regulator [Cumulibacter manganitolerans]|uniref:TetR/AcrR family transcriptional regulator n=1 Tax=Cumulibacter manganitolerans TaxID=1884992 RepID=UPI001296C74F|nr:TetR/AcrR family transcriptional regulator [Cumulibacter manganitolerans]